jgi:putative hemolysin
VWLDLDDPPELLRRKIMDSPYSRFPVGEGGLDDVIGEVRAKDLLIHVWEGRPFDLRALVQAPLYVPEIMPALKVLEEFRQSGTQLALVIDEYGSVQGVVTLTDILEAIVGDIPSGATQDEPQVVQREDGSWLVDGMLPIEDFKSAMDLDDLPGEEQGLYQTVAGFVVSQLGQMPETTDTFVWEGLRFEVMDMDGQRVDKILVAIVPPCPNGVGAEED